MLVSQHKTIFHLFHKNDYTKVYIIRGRFIDVLHADWTTFLTPYGLEAHDFVIG